MRLIAALLCLALAACVPSGRPLADGPGGLPFAVADPRELIVLTADAPEPLIARAEALGYALLAIHPLPRLGDTLVSLRIPEGTTIPEAIAEIEAALPGVTAGANHLYELQSDLTEAGRDYAGPMIGWPAGGCAARTRIGMLDGGVAPGHPGLAAGRIVQAAFGDGPASPAVAHGGRVASLLVGPGRLRGATLYSANVVAEGDAAAVVPILRGIDWLSSHGVRVVNISLAGPRNKLMDRALSRAARDGTVLVAAVGNAGPDAPPRFPAAFPFVLAVTAVDRDGAVYRRAVRGAHVDIAAPGVDILLPAAGGLSVGSGTSLAAPYVTAAVAADPALAARPVEAVRQGLAARARDIGPAGRDPLSGAGLLDASGAC